MSSKAFRFVVKGNLWCLPEVSFFCWCPVCRNGEEEGGGLWDIAENGRRRRLRVLAGVGLHMGDCAGENGRDVR